MPPLLGEPELNNHSELKRNSISNERNAAVKKIQNSDDVSEYTHHVRGTNGDVNSNDPNHMVLKFMYIHDKWPYGLEGAFTNALRLIIKNGTAKMKIRNRNYGRNELISMYIKYHTGETRTKKQISSHIQVWKKSIMNKVAMNHRLSPLEEEILHLIEYGPPNTVETVRVFHEVFEKIIDHLHLQKSDKYPQSLPPECDLVSPTYMKTDTGCKISNVRENHKDDYSPCDSNTHYAKSEPKPFSFLDNGVYRNNSSPIGNAISTPGAYNRLPYVFSSAPNDNPVLDTSNGHHLRTSSVLPQLNGTTLGVNESNNWNANSVNRTEVITFPSKGWHAHRQLPVLLPQVSQQTYRAKQSNNHGLQRMSFESPPMESISSFSPHRDHNGKGFYSERPDLANINSFHQTKIPSKFVERRSRASSYGYIESSLLSYAESATQSAIASSNGFQSAPRGAQPVLLPVIPPIGYSHPNRVPKTSGENKQGYSPSVEGSKPNEVQRVTNTNEPEANGF